MLKNNCWLNGYFQNCGLAGDLFCIDGSNVLIKDCASVVPGLGRPTISMNGAGSASLSVRNNNGGITIKDCNTALDVVTVEVAQGSLTFDSSCTDGEMVARGVCKFVDETTGATVTDETLPPEKVRDRLEQVWQLMGLDPVNPMTVTPTSRVAGDINQVITGDGETTSTVTTT